VHGRRSARDVHAQARSSLAAIPLTFAIEYERTLKSEQKYARSWRRLRANGVYTQVYLAPWYEILISLRWHCEQTRLNILFGMVDEFKKEVVITGAEIRPRPFQRGAGSDPRPSAPPDWWRAPSGERP